MDILRNAIRSVPDFPKPGINFYDITPMLADARAFTTAIDALADRYIGDKIDVVLGIDARGFLLASAVAYKLGKGLTIVRKAGKLPWQSHRASYALEYGEATIEMHVDGVKHNQRVLVVDDVLATGGTARAAAELVAKAGGRVHEFAFLLELPVLGGRRKLEPQPAFSLLQYT
jgi:adenine phosphoribosyltransferase